ncbi:MAG: sigma-70 family RNA polymerase sigma factor [Pedosphaera sp.]|nr:sigma-70 family RNA polymerase sigma factor [Pedosphaera sp.]
MADVTQILARAQQGDPNAAEELLPLVYDELRGIASGMMAREKPGQTLQATALVHEAWLRLGGDQQIAWQNRAHFFGAAAEAMRRILIDRARKRLARASSSLDSPEVLIESQIQLRVPETELLALHDVLDHLAEVDPDGARLVKLRYFVGMNMTEAAEALGISHRNAERLWTFAKAWLREAIRRER